jgi:pimeloyl-ACP methyl ester carboxylesterase
MGEQVRARNLDSWVERHGHGPEVLIIAGLGDPVEAWQFQLDGLSDRYRLTAYDARGVGRTRIPEESAHGARRGRGRRRPAGGARDPSRPRGPPGPGAVFMARSSPCGIPNWSAAWLLVVRNQESKAVG